VTQGLFRIAQTIPQDQLVQIHAIAGPTTPNAIRILSRGWRHFTVAEGIQYRRDADWLAQRMCQAAGIDPAAAIPAYGPTDTLRRPEAIWLVRIETPGSKGDKFTVPRHTLEPGLRRRTRHRTVRPKYAAITRLASECRAAGGAFIKIFTCILRRHFVLPPQAGQVSTGTKTIAFVSAASERQPHEPATNRAACPDDHGHGAQIPRQHHYASIGIMDQRHGSGGDC